MKASERDQILKDLVDYIKSPTGLVTRLDERTIFMCREIKELKEHQILQNGNVANTVEECSKNRETIGKNHAWLKAIRWVVIIIAGSIAALMGTNIAGVW